MGAVHGMLLFVGDVMAACSLAGRMLASGCWGISDTGCRCEYSPGRSAAYGCGCNRFVMDVTAITVCAIVPFILMCWVLLFVRRGYWAQAERQKYDRRLPAGSVQQSCGTILLALIWWLAARSLLLSPAGYRSCAGYHLCQPACAGGHGGNYSELLCLVCSWAGALRTAHLFRAEMKHRSFFVPLLLGLVAW